MRLNNYTTWISKIDWNKPYSPQTRILLHLLMWTFLSILYFNGYNRYDQQLGWLFVTKDLTSIMIIFYAGLLLYTPQIII
ncbi:hypothetical protein [Pedobacter sp. NJ-S-72]